MPLQCENAVAKKRSTELNILLAVRIVVVQKDVDMVGGDFNGASWRRRSGPDQQLDSMVEEAPKNAKRPMLPGHTLVGA